MDNRNKKIVPDKEEPLGDIMPLVITKIEACLLTEANQILKFNEEMGTCNVAEAEEITCSEDALQIMKEANLAAQNALRARFPAIPETHPQKLGITI